VTGGKWYPSWPVATYGSFESFKARKDEKHERKEHQRARYGWKTRGAKTKARKTGRK
jgi:hypothetical protein